MTANPVDLDQGTGAQKLDANLVNRGGEDLSREIMVAGDPDDPDGLARVMDTDPVGTEMGSVMRLVRFTELLNKFPSYERDPGNQQTALLGSGGNFTGTWKLVENAQGIGVAYLTDAAPASFNMEFSQDGISVDTNFGTNPVSVVDLGGFFLGIFQEGIKFGKYFRVNITNGVTPQTMVQSMAAVSNTPITASSAIIGGPIFSARSGLVTNSVTRFDNGIGAFESVSATNPLPVDGSGTVQPVSGPLTDAELRATPVDVTGPLTDTELRATPVDVVGPLTDTELRATPVDVAGPLTDTELRASPIDADVTAWLGSTAPTVGQKVAASSLPVVLASDVPVSTATANVSSTAALAALNAVVTVALAGRQGASFHLDAGTLAATLITEASFDGGVSYFQTYWTSPSTENHFNFAVVTNPNGVLNITIPLPSGTTHVRVRLSAYTSGTATATITATMQEGYGQNLAQAAAGGTGVPPSTLQVGGIEASATKLRTVAVSANGIQTVFNPAQSILEGNLTGCTAGRIAGRVSTAAVTEVAVRKTTYTEQSAGAQRSINSTSASDAAAGTGIRTVRITYYTLTAGVIAGPFTEDKTMNGVTGVNTTATNICYIESIEALTVGSTGAAVGTIQLWTGLAATGSVFGSIAATDRRTKWAHHYIPNGQTCFVDNVAAAFDGATGNVALYQPRWRNPASSVSAQMEMLDCHFVQGGTGVNQIRFETPRAAAGPAIIEWFVTPSATAAMVHLVESEFYEI